MNIRKKTIWIYGLSASGKSTISNALHNFFSKNLIQSIILDGDILRTGINKDLGFSEQDRHENIRRTSEIAKILNKANITVIASLITPLESQRELIKSILKDDVILVYLNCPIETCIKRDPKGLYKKALSGKISEFTGISAPFEKSKNSLLAIDTSKTTVEECINQIISKIK